MDAMTTKRTGQAVYADAQTNEKLSLLARATGIPKSLVLRLLVLASSPASIFRLLKNNKEASG